MAQAETNIANDIMKELATHGVTLFKNVRGLFITRDGKRMARAGLLADGSSDLIGFCRVVVTPEMVGSTVAIITAIEVKTATGQEKLKQRDFRDFIREAGGLAGVARSPDDARKICKIAVDRAN